MLFNSYQFLLFFPLITIIYYVIPRKARTAVLLAASYYFYMSWNPKYIILIVASTVITYLSGVLIEIRPDIKKSILIACILCNIGILFFFKYFNWAVGCMNTILRIFTGASVDIGWNVILPVGISFYTFQALSYTADVYRGTISAERNIVKYALFVSFFPQLVAGPIERSENLLPQIEHLGGIKFEYERVVKGIILVIWGLYMKMVIADRIAILVDEVFENYLNYGTVELIVGAVAFSIQIYCDFASYSIIAAGAAGVLGIKLMSNFETPYFSQDIKEFWRRWHISLSSWLKDYVYIPLGGNRCSKIRKYSNLLVTFLISGLWHGADGTYVLWGGVHGIFQIIGEATKPVKSFCCDKLGIKTDCWSWRALKVIIAFALTTFAWIFFRCSSITAALSYIKRIFITPDWWALFDGSLFQLGLDQKEWGILRGALMILLIVDVIKYKSGEQLDTVLCRQNAWFRWLVIIFMISSIWILGVYGPDVSSETFIYFQF